MLKRRAKGRLFRSENWSSHWYVLEGATLAEYKGFDTATSKPLGAPRLVPVARCRVAPNEALSSNGMHVLTVYKRAGAAGAGGAGAGASAGNAANVELVSLAASNENERKLWMIALKRAARAGGDAPARLDLARCRAELGLAPDAGGEDGAPLDARAIKKAFQRTSLRAHPDKGGSGADFDALTAARDTLLAHAAHEEVAASYARLRYAVRLRRLPGAAAFGIVVAERAGKPRPDEPVDATDLSSRIYVKEILAPLKDAMLGPPELVAPRDDARAARYALAHPAPGDVLARVDDDDVTPWPAARVSMRLSASRVPVGGAVRLEFLRAFRVDETSQLDELSELGAPPGAAGAPGGPPGGPPGGGDDGDDELVRLRARVDSVLGAARDAGEASESAPLEVAVDAVHVPIIINGDEEYGDGGGDDDAVSDASSWTEGDDDPGEVGDAAPSHISWCGLLGGPADGYDDDDGGEVCGVRSPGVLRYLMPDEVDGASPSSLCGTRPT